MFPIKIDFEISYSEIKHANHNTHRLQDSINRNPSRPIIPATARQELHFIVPGCLNALSLKLCPGDRSAGLDLRTGPADTPRTLLTFTQARAHPEGMISDYGSMPDGIVD